MSSSESALAPAPTPESSGPSTVYQGPVATATVVVGGQPIHLVRPADPDRLLDAPDVAEWNRRDDYMPYWAYLWPGAFLLAEAVAREPWPADAAALEIGCGLGLAGLAALTRGVKVTFSDYDGTPLDFAGRSARANGVSDDRFGLLRLDWRSLPDLQFPYILGADVLYERPLVPLVAGVLARMLAPGGTALIAGPYRVASEDFPAELARRGLTFESSPVHAESAELGPVRGTLYRVRQ
ncbi:MAG: methyltransferase, partial [Isosphaeraceae bacterium]